MVNILNDIENLFFPDLCLGCNILLLSNESVICTSCRHQIPLTNFHTIKANPIEKIFYGRFPVKAATSFLFFEKETLVQKLIHKLKYQKQQHIGTFLGEWMGDILAEDNNYQNIDYVVPVPLHPKKIKKRGYNQVTHFARELAKKLNASYNDAILERTQHSATQTLKNRIIRSEEITSVFTINNTLLFQNKHVLLVDDIVTTGATLEACAHEILKTKNVSLSVATMAYTQ